MNKVLSLLTLLLLVTSVIGVSSAETTSEDIAISIEMQYPDTGVNSTIPAPMNVSFGSPVSVRGNESVQLMTPSGIYVNVTPSGGVEITINQTTTNPYGNISAGRTSIGIFLDIEMNDTTVEVEAVIAIPYNDSMIEGINETSLELQFYNDTTGLWETVPSWVDLTNKIVYGNTTHFSTWTATGEDSVVKQDPVDPPKPPVNESRRPVNVTYGSPVSIRGNESVQLMTPSGVYVNVTPSEGVEITINQTTSNPYGNVSEGRTSIGIFLEIEMNDTSVEIDATLAIPYNSSMIEGLNESALELQYYNETTGLWESVPSWVDTETKVVYGNTTHFSTWTATGETVEEEQGQDPPTTGPPEAVPGVPFEITPGKPVAVAPGNRVELVTPSGITVAVTPGDGVEITIDEFTTNPKGALPENLESIGIYLTIELNDSSVDIDATLSLPYQVENLGDLRENSLTFRFFNESTGTWDAVPSWVDTDNGMVHGNTTHFSTWTVTGEVQNDTTSSTADDTSGGEVATNETAVPFLGLFLASFGVGIAVINRKMNL